MLESEGREKGCKMLSLGYDAPIANMLSQQLLLPALVLHKKVFANNQSCFWEGTLPFLMNSLAINRFLVREKSLSSVVTSESTRFRWIALNPWPRR